MENERPYDYGAEDAKKTREETYKRQRKQMSEEDRKKKLTNPDVIAFDERMKKKDLVPKDKKPEEPEQPNMFK